MSAATHCHGCGVELAPPKKFGHRRKWCSERCRKAQYAGTCVDCGAPTSGSSGKGGSPLRCVSCDRLLYGSRARAKWQPHRELVERLWAEGKTAREIAAVVGWKVGNPGVAICVLRNQQGYNLPHRRTPEQIARITADAGEHLRRARAARGRAA